MATFTFSNKTTQKPVEHVKPKRNIKVVLKKYDKVDYSPEHYSYVNSEGEVCRYTGVMTTDIDGTYVGKVITTHRIELQYHPKVDAVEGVDEYFSYIDGEGRERIFIGKPQFNLETNSYFGETVEDVLEDRIINIYKEDK